MREKSGYSHYVNDERVARFDRIIQIHLNVLQAGRNELQS